MKCEIVIDSLITKSGDLITFIITNSSNKPYFRITQTSRFSSSSYYDGDSLEKAKDIYGEIVLAFKGIKAMEQFNKKDLTCYVEQMEQLIKKDNQDLTYMQLKSDPLFLGINPF